MGKRSVHIILTIVLADFLLTGLWFYSGYAGRMIYEENSTHLEELYEQINKTFHMFVQRNWNVLYDWDDDLRYVDSEEDLEIMWKSLKRGKESWQYSDFYMFNEECSFITADGRQGQTSSIEGTFQKLYLNEEPIISAYTATNGVRKMVFAIPMEKCFLWEGVCYTGLAVSYDVSVAEKLLSSELYHGQSDCYVVDKDGNFIFPMEDRTELEEEIKSLDDLEKKGVQWIRGSGEAVRKGLAQNDCVSAQYLLEGEASYLIVVPVEIGELSLLGIVRSSAVDSGARRLQRATTGILGTLIVVTALAILLVIMRLNRVRLLRKEKERLELENMANTDGLTGLFNERFFSEVLRKKEKARQPFVLYYLDLDHFKPVNDTYGHEVGDQLLQKIGFRLQSCIRSGDYAFRIGGDEFALIVSADFTEQQCVRMSERIRELLCSPVELDSRKIRVGVSCGYAKFPSDCQDASGVRILADHRMYEEKKRHHAED